MYASSASVTKARIVAALLTATSPMAGAFSASAQQMASGPNYSKCDAIKDHGQQAECYVDSSIANSKARIKAADERTAAGTKTIAANTAVITVARKEEICGDKLLAVAQDPKKREAGQQILAAARKSPGEYGMCRLLAELTQ
jgi:hypothetical protein